MTEYLDFLEEAKRVLEEAKINVGLNELESAFDLVLNLTKNSHKLYENEIILKKQRYSELQHENRNGLLSVTDKNIIHSQICYSFLGVINKIGNKIDEDLKKEKIKYDNHLKKNAAQYLDNKKKQNIQPADSSTNSLHQSSELKNNIKPSPSIYEIQVRDDFSTTQLEKYLLESDFRNADVETSNLFLTIVDDTNKIFDQKFILHFPYSLFQEIDSLWAKHSDNKFGFSAQRNIWDALPKKDSDYIKVEKFAILVGWKINEKWVRSSTFLNYKLTAPIGHLPTLTFIQYENTEKWRPMWINNFQSLTKKFA